MGLLISVLTPQFLLHVTDVRADLRPRTLAVHTGLVTGLVSVLSDEAGTVPWLRELSDKVVPTLPPPGVAEVFREGATRRWERLRASGTPIDVQPASLLFTGWGTNRDMGQVAFRFTVTNFEHAGQTSALGQIDLEDGEVSAQFATYGGDFVHRDRTMERPFSVVVSGALDYGDRLREALDQVARRIKKGRDAEEVAMAAEAVVKRFREVAGPSECGSNTLLAQLLPDGSTEAAILEGARTIPVELAKLGA